LPLAEVIKSDAVIEQARMRLMSSLNRARYDPHPSMEVEYPSFIVAALVASQDSGLATKFALREASEARHNFARERVAEKTDLMARLFDVKITQTKKGFSVPFQVFLLAASKYGLVETSKSPRWKLVNLGLEGGLIHFSDDALVDLFKDLSMCSVLEVVKRARTVSFPEALRPFLESVMRYVPPGPKGKGPKQGYRWVEDLLQHPIPDGRHRFVWMVLAPYLVNVKKVSDEEATQKIKEFAGVSGDKSDMLRFIKYQVKRARRNGLMPPTIAKLKSRHPDLYALLPNPAEMSGKPEGH